MLFFIVYFLKNIIALFDIKNPNAFIDACYRRFDILSFIIMYYTTIARNSEKYGALSYVYRLFPVWLDLSVEYRHVRRNMILWTFLAYIAIHYVIESKRLILVLGGQC